MLSSPKQPSKKRRIESQQDEAGPSDEVLIVHEPKSSLVKKSASLKCTMYSKKKGNSSKSKLLSFSLPSFTKASKFFKDSSHNKIVENSKLEDTDTDLSVSDISLQEKVISLVDLESNGAAKTSQNRKTSFPKTVKNKIKNYFKPIPHPTNKKRKSSITTSESNSTGTSDIVEIVSADAISSDIAAQNEAFFSKVNNYYGLLGEINETNDENINYFERLPVHIIENILCQIPFSDLMRCRLVCTEWNEIISNNKFLEWKKAYYGVKLGNPVYADHMPSICKSLGLVNLEDCFPVLIKYMANKFSKKPPSDLGNLMKKNLKAVDARSALAERFPEIDGKESKAWAIFTLAILLSESVWDVYNLYKCITTINSSCLLHDVTDAMYCVATFLLFFKNKWKINHGLHYRVYYALYMIENNLPQLKTNGVQTLKIPKGLSGQQSIHCYSETINSHLTYEQIRILNHRLEPKQVIKVVALAGTGKTTTLIHMARLYPQVNFLNVMYNKAVCDEGKRRFPPNVTCKTAHSLAYKNYGKELRHKLVFKLRPHDLVPHIEHQKGCQLHIYSYAKFVLNTIEKFVSSSEKEILLSDVPTSHPDISTRILSESDRMKILKDAQQLWRKIIDKDNKVVKATHDVYLKLFQLSEPKFPEYKCIMVDEAQDCNAAMLDIVLSQNLPVILVGDPNQQIYGFRGANNALQTVDATHVFHLTKSFRFGPEIAYIASCCLEVLKFNKYQTIVGNCKPSSIAGEIKGQYAIIARTNVQLFNEAVRLCVDGRKNHNEPTYIHGAFAGGIKSYNFDQMLDIYKLRTPNSRGETDNHITDKFISKFKNFTDLWSYAKRAEDCDLLSKIDLVNQHGSNIPEYIRIIKEKCNYSIEFANVVFSTAHKAKGLEFDSVCLTNDYQIGRVPYNVSDSQTLGEEASILYVALTRAKKCLILSEKLLTVLLLAQEKFEYPVSSKSLVKEHSELRCIICNDIFVPHTALVLFRHKIITGSNRVIPGGPLCMRCRTEPTVRPQVHTDAVIMYLDPTNDYAHRSMTSLVGPLPSDPPINHNSFGGFHEMEIVYYEDY